MKLSKKTLFLLTFVIILAIFLRFFHLSDIPASLYSDEIDQGYNAYSILTTGADEHGIFLPVSLRSFGDWKPPLQSYLMIPFIWVFGLSETSVRLPSAILGTATVMLTFFLARLLFSDEKNATKIALLSTLYMAISPWHILQSRSAMLVAIGLFFLSSGIYTFLLGQKNKLFIYISAVSFVFAVYSYYGLRVIAPLILIFLLIKYRQIAVSGLKHFLLAASLGLVLFIPLFAAFVRQPDVVFGRARTVSIFFDQGINLYRWELIAQDGVSTSTLVTKFFHNGLYLYGRSIIQRFLSHFDIRYLFIQGDQSQPFQISEMGILNFADLVFIPVGLFLLFKYKYKSRWLIFLFLLISIFPASITFMTPSNNRTFNAVIPYSLLAGVGIAFIANKFSQTKVAVVITLFYVFGFWYFMRAYFIQLPQNHADWWNWGWREVVSYVYSNEEKYNNIIIPDVGMPYVYFLFYEKYPASDFQKNAIRTYVADRFGFEHVEGFGKYLFPTDFDWNFTRKNNLQKNTLYVIPASSAPNDNNYIKAIYYPNGKIAYKIFAYE